MESPGIAVRDQSPLEHILVKAESIKGYKFECTQCGKCCCGPVSVTFREALALSKDMIFRLGFQCSLIRHGKNDIPGDQASLMMDLGCSRIYAPEFGGTLIVHPHMRAYSHQSERSVEPKCPMVMDSGGCKIYDRRPSICKSVPMVTMSPDRQLGNGLKSFGERFGCVTESKDSYISTAGINENRTALHHEAMYSAAAILVVDAMHAKLTPGSLSFSATMACFVYEMHALINKDERSGKVSKPEIREFASNQIELLEKAVHDAKRRKNKDERHVTRLMEQDIEGLREYLRKSAEGATDFLVA